MYDWSTTSYPSSDDDVCLTGFYSYITDMTPLCTLAIIASASRFQAPILRDFLQRYMSYRVFFGVSIVSQSTRELFLHCAC